MVPQVLCPALPHSPGPSGCWGSRWCSRYLGCRWARQALGEEGPQLRPGEKPVLTSPPAVPARASLEPVCFCHQKLGGKMKAAGPACFPSRSRLPCDEVEIRSQVLWPCPGLGTHVNKTQNPKAKPGLADDRPQGNPGTATGCLLRSCKGDQLGRPLSQCSRWEGKGEEAMSRVGSVAGGVPRASHSRSRDVDKTVPASTHPSRPFQQRCDPAWLLTVK